MTAPNSDVEEVLVQSAQEDEHAPHQEQVVRYKSPGYVRKMHSTSIAFCCFTGFNHTSHNLNPVALIEAFVHIPCSHRQWCRSDLVSPSLPMSQSQKL